MYLTALNHRQCAGRAGRRGFDLLNNVVFHGISEQKVHRLLSFRLPDLNGHFPLTTTLVLRLFILLHESGNSAYAVSAVNALLSQPRLYLGGESFRDQTLHHLRFSIEYLRRQSLLDPNRTPLNFAGLVTYLHYTENSLFAFHALLKESYFHGLCAGIDDQESETLLQLMLVMAHLFGRVHCRRVDLEYKQNVVELSSSIAFLPALPEEAANILKDHNKQTLQVYQTYVRTFVGQHVRREDNELPLTGVIFGGTKNEDERMAFDEPTSIRSAFVALSGWGDGFESVHDLCSTTRSGIFLEEAVIPYMDICSEDNTVPLNAWLLDFFKHGDVKALEHANGIRRSDVWFHLNNFSLVLATIFTSLSNLLKITDGQEMDMLDVDAFDEVEDAKDVMKSVSAATDTAQTPELGMRAHQGMVQKPTRRNAKIAGPWDDESEDDATDVGPSSVTPSKFSGCNVVSDLENLSFEHNRGLLSVLKAFQKLQIEFNQKFRAMWA